nr:hypothetical protein [Tanacetum cinerariifolium]
SALNSKLLSINFESQHLDKKKQEVKNVIEQPTECGTRIVKSLQNFRIIHKTSSISLNNTSQISPVHAIAPVLPIEEPEYSLSMGYKHLNTTPEMKSDEIIKSGVEELVPIPNDFKKDDISSDDDVFKDIEYVEASPLDLELVSLEEENVVDLEDIFQIQDVVLREKLLSINRLIANIESLNDNPTPDCVLKSSASFPIFEESDNSLSFSDNSSPEFETFSDQTEETRKVDLFLASDNSIPPGIENFSYDLEGDIRFLEEFLIDDSIPFPNNESFDFEDNPLFPRPPPEPPDVEFFFDSKPDVIAEEILDECFDPGEEINICANDEDDDYFPFMFIIRIFLPYLIFPEVFPLLLSSGSEDTIFDSSISV